MSAMPSPSTVVSAPSRLDRATLDANTMSDPSLQAELFELFFDQMPRNIEMLRAAVDTLPVDEGRSVAKTVGHTIKGTARTLGLLELAAAAIALEETRAVTAEGVETLINAAAAAQSAAAAYLATRQIR